MYKFINKIIINGFGKLGQSLILLAVVFHVGCQNESKYAVSYSSPEVKIELSREVNKEDKSSSSVKFTFEITDGWHLYGPLKQKNGRPTIISFSDNSAAKIADIVWPQTKEFDEGVAGKSIGYSGKFEVLGQVKEVDISKHKFVEATVTWVACRDVCVPGETILILPF